MNTSSAKQINISQQIRINKNTYPIKLVEENGTLISSCKCWLWRGNKSIGEGSNIDNNYGLEVLSSKSECSSNEERENIIKIPWSHKVHKPMKDNGKALVIEKTTKTVEERFISNLNLIVKAKGDKVDSN